jgi:hypothetical protein
LYQSQTTHIKITTSPNQIAKPTPGSQGTNGFMAVLAWTQILGAQQAEDIEQDDDTDWHAKEP